jgi:hypothetical protein
MNTLRAKDQRDTRIQNGSVLLMARIVDREGVCIRPANVRGVEYSLLELDPCWPNSLNLVAGCCAVPLDVDEVLFDLPEVDELWTVDAVGYNFRHEIDWGHTARFPNAGFQYEVHYQLTLACGTRTCVRFCLRC